MHRADMPSTPITRTNGPSVLTRDPEDPIKGMGYDSAGSCPKQEGHNDIEGFINYVLEDIRKYGRRKDGRQKSKAFLLIRGGNVYFIRKLIHFLKRNGLRQELRWLLGTDRSHKLRGQRRAGVRCQQEGLSANMGSRERVPCTTRMCHFFGFMFIFIWYVILTPIFYAVHSIVHQIYMSNCWKRPSQNADLPLFYALLSENPNMVRLFLENGSSSLSQDKDGNNVYHYLADLSLEEPHEAWRCHQVLSTCVADTKTLREVITRQKNALGLTALEVVAKFGSLHFFQKLSNEEAAIGSQILKVSEGSLAAKISDAKTSSEIKLNLDPDVNDGIITDAERRTSRSSLRVVQIDVSMWENNDIMGRQSYPLQLISSRNVDAMPEIDVNSLLQCKFINKWMQRKLRRYFVYIVIGHLIELLVTLLFLVFIVNQGGDMTIFPLIRPFFELYMEKGGNITDNTNGTRITLDSNGKLVTPCYETMVTWYNGSVNKCTAHALDALNDVCSPLTKQTQLNFIFILDNAEFSDSESVDLFFQYAIAGILFTKILLDLMLRLSFLCYNYNFGASSFCSGIAPLLFRRIPGSYTERQVMLFMATLFASFLYSMQLLNETVVTDDGRYINRWIDFYFPSDPVQMAKDGTLYNVNTFVARKAELLGYYEPLVSKLVVICLLFRFLLSIHILRLFPGIGFFIITTKKMAKHLCQFAVVFIIVSLAFAAIFHFIMRNPKCPALKEEGFGSLADSLFSAYQVAIGGASYDFTEHVNARVAFIIYTLISIMLLLNLIIAVMTTTAQELNRMPWRQGLCAVERWDEILGTEVMVRMLFWPATKCAQLLRAMGLECMCRDNKEEHGRIEVIQIQN